MSKHKNELKETQRKVHIKRKTEKRNETKEEGGYREICKWTKFFKIT